MSLSGLAWSRQGRHCASRPRSIRPARSSTFRCFETAGRLISKGSASFRTEVSPEARRARIARRVGSARAAKVALRRSGDMFLITPYLTYRLNTSRCLVNRGWQQGLTSKASALYYSYMNKPAKLRSTNPGTADGQMMYSLVRAAHVLETRLEQALEEVGLSLPKFGALSHLVKEGEPLSLSECATKMTCVRSNITQLVDRLEADGLVCRVEDPEDRRAVRAVVTPLGKERYAAGVRQVEKVQGEFAETLSGIDQGSLERVLSAIR